MPKIYPLVLSIFTALLITGCSGGHTQTLYADMEEDEKPTDDTVLRVSDEYTAAFGGTVGDTLNPVLGSDNKWHVLYELMLTNGRPIPASIREIKVVDYDDTDRVLHTITEAEIISAGVDLAGRSRLEAHDPILVDGDAVLQPNESMALYIDMVIDSINDIPDAIVHKFFGSAATNPGSSFASDVEYLMVPRALNKNELPAAGSPVTGDSWVVINGCCDVVGAHRGSIQTISGQLWGSQRFAIDWMKIGDNGKFFEGDPADVTSWYNYGEPVFAVADGTVVEVLDELPDQPPGQLPDPNSITINTVDGNHVILDIGQGVYVFYAHLKLAQWALKRVIRFSWAI
ncbi:Uncharacterised protein [Halioglobus japonicus]|nr:Uncharacterised protein [Halioglobus japonicus]